MYTLSQILSMPYDPELRFTVKGKDCLYYVDERKVLRFKSTNTDDIVSASYEVLNWKFEIAKQPVSFIEAFNEWYYNKKTISCDICPIEWNKYMSNRNKEEFPAYAIAEGKWYVKE